MPVVPRLFFLRQCSESDKCATKSRCTSERSAIDFDENVFCEDADVCV